MEEIIEDIPTENRVQMYVKFNEDKTYGFYHVEEHGEDITGDKSYIPITDDGYQTLMDNQGDLAIGELPTDVTEIGVEHLVEVPEQEPLPPTEEEQKWEQTTLAIKLLIPSLPDENILQIPLLFDEWEVGVDYVADKSVVRYEDILYRVRQSHRSQPDWLPPDVPALYLMIVPPEEVGKTLPWEDRHKMGKELYMTGDQVTHQGYYWTSMVDNNHWEPTDANWAAWEKGDSVV